VVTPPDTVLRHGHNVSTVCDFNCDKEQKSQSHLKPLKYELNLNILEFVIILQETHRISLEKTIFQSYL
jgi:hypothetical protein